MDSPLIVRCVPSQGPVPRFGSGFAGRSAMLIGAERDPQTGAITYHPEQDVVIPASEVARYRREYTRALREGSLRRVETQQRVEATQ